MLGSPLFCDAFYFIPLTFDFVFFPDFGCISFDVVRLGPPIGIDWMSMFQFGPPSFNFRILFKLFNKFSTKNKIKNQGTEVKSITKWGTLLHFYVQERERKWPASLTGSRRGHGHFYGERATVGGRT